MESLSLPLLPVPGQGFIQEVFEGQVQELVTKGPHAPQGSCTGLGVLYEGELGVETINYLRNLKRKGEGERERERERGHKQGLIERGRLGGGSVAKVDFLHITLNT